MLDWALSMTGALTFRPFKLLRPGVLLIRHREVRKAAYVVYSTIPEVLGLFAALLGFIVAFGIVGLYAFSGASHAYTPKNGSWVDDQEARAIKTAFDTLPHAALRLLVLFSSENYPSLLIPAMDKTNAAFLYFFAFVYVGVFFIRGVILATIVSIYLDKAKHYVAKDRRKEWKGLIKAFNLLDIEQNGFITFEQWSLLMQQLRPRSSEAERRFLFNILNREHNGKLDSLDFLDLREITQLHLTLVKEARPTVAGRELTCWNIFSRSLKRRTKSKAYRALTLVLILLNSAVACGYHRTVSAGVERGMLAANIALVLAMEASLLAKYVGLGYTAFYEKSENQADVVATTIALVCYCAAIGAVSMLRWLIPVGHICILLRLMWFFKSGRMALLLFRRIAPPLVYTTLMTICFLYMYAVLGMQIFNRCVADANTHRTLPPANLPRRAAPLDGVEGRAQSRSCQKVDLPRDPVRLAGLVLRHWGVPGPVPSPTLPLPLMCCRLLRWLGHSQVHPSGSTHGVLLPVRLQSGLRLAWVFHVWPLPDTRQQQLERADEQCNADSG